jgi:hypothetical protein
MKPKTKANKSSPPRIYPSRRTAYKLLRKRADGTLGPLFINRHQVIPLGKWVNAKPHPTAGFAFRPYWHCAPQPFAPHLSTKNRVWMQVCIASYWKFYRPHIQGGAWLLAERMKLIKEVQPKGKHE